jgi:hypothetical protein
MATRNRARGNRHLQRVPVSPKEQLESRGIIRGQDLDLGDFGGEAEAPVTARFRWLGQEFRVNPDLTDVTVIDLFEQAQSVKVDDPRQYELAKDYVREHIHPDDFDRLWDAVVDNRKSVSDLMTLCWQILDKVTARPTGRPSDSSGGPPATSPSSPAGSSVRDIAQPFVERFEEERRPDLASQVMLAVEARERAQAGATG